MRHTSRAVARATGLGLLVLVPVALFATPFASIGLLGAFLFTGLVDVSRIPPAVLPGAWWVYAWYFGGDPRVRPFLLWTGGIPFGVALLAVAVALFRHRTRRTMRPARPGEQPAAPVRAASDAHGSAVWMGMAEARGHFPGPHPEYGGVVVGEAYRPDLDRGVARQQDGSGPVPFNPADPGTWGQGGKAPLLVDPLTSDAAHGTVIAGSGGYKTTSITLPTLCLYTGSVVVNDPPAQVGRMAEAMRREMGHDVRFVRPGGDCIDALGWIDPADPLAETYALDVIDAICGDVSEKAKGDNAPFVQGGRKLLACLLADMLWNPALPRSGKTLREFRRRVTTPERKMKGLLQEIAEGSASELARDYARTVMDTYVETFSGVYFNATSETDFLALAPYAEMVSRPDFDPAALCGGKLTVFLQIPENTMRATPALGRLVVTTFRGAIRRAEGDLAGRVLFLLDEARFFRKLDVLADMMTADRKFGLSVVTMWQSETDLAAIWKEEASVFSSNSSWTLYAAITDQKTAEHVSKEVGRFTMLVRTESTSTGSQAGSGSSSRSQGHNESFSEQGRPLIQPEELRKLRADVAVVLRRGAPALLCGRAIYFRRPEMAARIRRDRLAGKRAA